MSRPAKENMTPEREPAYRIGVMGREVLCIEAPGLSCDVRRQGSITYSVKGREKHSQLTLTETTVVLLIAVGEQRHRSTHGVVLHSEVSQLRV